jgi:hypothetical protein
MSKILEKNHVGSRNNKEAGSGSEKIIPDPQDGYQFRYLHNKRNVLGQQ